jgi:hypothetical protein
MPATTKPTLHEALLEVQKEALQLELPKSKTNPHFGHAYTPLDVVLGAVVPLLNKHGFVLIQSPTWAGNESAMPALTTTFIHVPTGEKLENTALLLPGRNDPQGQGAAITYLKRYAIMSILGLTSDEDDDGNASMAPRSNTSSGGGQSQTSNNGGGGAGFDASSGSPI